MDQLNNQLKSGILPPQLNYSRDSNIIDWSKLQYNRRYQSFDFYARKFPEQWADDPLFEPVIQMIADRAKINNITPLAELNKISNNNIEDVFSNSLEFQTRRQL